MIAPGLGLQPRHLSRCEASLALVSAECQGPDVRIAEAAAVCQWQTKPQSAKQAQKQATSPGLPALQAWLCLAGALTTGASRHSASPAMSHSGQRRFSKNLASRPPNAGAVGHRASAACPSNVRTAFAAARGSIAEVDHFTGTATKRTSPWALAMRRRADVLPALFSVLSLSAASEGCFTGSWLISTRMSPA